MNKQNATAYGIISTASVSGEETTTFALTFGRGRGLGTGGFVGDSGDLGIALKPSNS
jgi:hypothetical protein